MLKLNYEVNRCLDEIGSREDVLIIYSCVVGSRVTGLYNRGSDVDIKYIYVPPIDRKLSVFNEVPRTLPEEKIDTASAKFEFFGHSLSHFLYLHRKHNLQALEMLRTPSGYKHVNKYFYAYPELLRVQNLYNETRQALSFAKGLILDYLVDVKTVKRVAYLLCKAQYYISYREYPKLHYTNYHGFKGYGILVNAINNTLSKDPKDYFNELLFLHNSLQSDKMDTLKSEEPVELPTDRYDEIYQEILGKVWSEL